VVRRARRSRDDVRSEWGIEASERVLLLHFGGQTTQWQLEVRMCDVLHPHVIHSTQDDNLPQGWKCLILGAKPEHLPSTRWVCVPSTAFVPDLVNASDVAMGKVSVKQRLVGHFLTSLPGRIWDCIRMRVSRHTVDIRTALNMA
jgi:hypothetical protein